MRSLGIFYLVNLQYKILKQKKPTPESEVGKKISFKRDYSIPKFFLTKGRTLSPFSKYKSTPTPASKM